MLSKESIAKIIKARDFHDIPDWMIQMIDAETYLYIHEYVADTIASEHTDASTYALRFCRSTKFSDCISFLNRLGDARVIDAKELANKLYPDGKYSCGKVIKSLAYMFNDKDWKKFFTCSKMRYPCDSVILSMDAFITICQIYMYRFSTVPAPVIKEMLKHFDVLINSGDSEQCVYTFFHNISNVWVEENVQPAAEWLHIVAGNSFVDSLMDVVIKRANKYYWGGYIFSIYNIWSYSIPYCPTNINIEHLMMYLNHFSSIPFVELSDRIMDMVHKIAKGKLGGKAIKTLVFEEIFSFLYNNDKSNPNNIRFIMPFYQEYNGQIDPLIYNMINDPSFINLKSPRAVLRDFTYLLPKKMNNDEFQQRFLRQYGDPNTLISGMYGGDTYIRTVEGVLYAIANSNEFYLKGLFQDDTVRQILINDIIGKEPFGQTIEKIISVLEYMMADGDNNPYADEIRVAINHAYPLLENGNNVCVPLLRISSIDPVEASLIIDRHPKAVFHIPVFRQCTKNLLVIARRECQPKYVPFNFGFSQNMGLEDIMNVTDMIALLHYNNSYLADIRNDDVADLMFRYSFMWINRAT